MSATDEARKLLEAATPGEWKVGVSLDAQYDDWPCFRIDKMIDANDTGPGSEVQADRCLIEKAPDTLRVAIGLAEAAERWRRHTELPDSHHCDAACFYPAQQVLAAWEALLPAKEVP